MCVCIGKLKMIKRQTDRQGKRQATCEDNQYERERETESRERNFMKE